MGTDFLAGGVNGGDLAGLAAADAGAGAGPRTGSSAAAATSSASAAGQGLTLAQKYNCNKELLGVGEEYMNDRTLLFVGASEGTRRGEFLGFVHAHFAPERVAPKAGTPFTSLELQRGTFVLLTNVYMPYAVDGSGSYV